MERVVRDELSRSDSPAITALRRSVKDRFNEQVGAFEVLDVLGRLWGMPIHIPPRAIREAAADGVALSPRPLTSLTAQPPSAIVRARASHDLARLVQSGLLPEDAVLEFAVYGVTHTARLRDGQIVLNGVTHQTLSAAASALRGGKATNGWASWKYRGASLADLRSRLPSITTSDASS
ncbi:MAG: hypothetical protein HYX52_00530 [Chloroflexi bacterium]|nr:hypothetical protein [Chloroflexota bacterium]